MAQTYLYSFIELIHNNVPAEYKSASSRLEAILLTEPEQPIDAEIKLLLREYCDNCSISYGYRSVYWDLAMTLMQEKYLDEAYDDLDILIPEYIPEWDTYKDCDAGMNLEPTLALAARMILNKLVTESTLPSFCHALRLFLEQLDDSSVDKDELLEALLSNFSNDDDE